ncbi:hypothetical protein GCM10011498_07170 [Amylibacter cionae]|uniref:Uncharacterized protein n=1 Tax=Neptunicoccus cionae TaxID=2035344 RepID=A0A916VN95_9RHOB|nr:hypothetical protein GCM10011498_07170 [Amylibacter cionae]
MLYRAGKIWSGHKGHGVNAKVGRNGGIRGKAVCQGMCHVSVTRRLEVKGVGAAS